MANKFFSARNFLKPAGFHNEKEAPARGESPATGHRAGRLPQGRDRTANWPGLPGKAQSKPRDTSGTEKLRQSPREEGL